MGQKNPTPKRDNPSNINMDTRKTRSFSPPQNKGLSTPPQKSSLMQKIKRFMSSDKNHHSQQDQSYHLMRNMNTESPSLVKKGLKNPLEKFKNMNVKVAPRKNALDVSPPQKRKLSMFEHIGISPNASPRSPTHLKIYGGNSKRNSILSINRGNEINSASEMKRSKTNHITKEEMEDSKEINKEKSSYIRQKKHVRRPPEISQEEKKDERLDPFHSPLIRQPKSRKNPVSNVSENLASNFSEYLNHLKAKNNHLVPIHSPKSCLTLQNLSQSKNSIILNILKSKRKRPSHNRSRI